MKKIILIFLILLLFCGTASAAWLDGYNYRTPINLTGGASGAQTDFQVLLNVTYNAHMQADFDDIRFTLADGTTLVDAWLESNTTDYALIDVKFPTTPDSGVNQTYYIYYGKSDAVSDWNGIATFQFFDDFEDGDYNGWTVDGAATWGIVTDGDSKVLSSTNGQTGVIYTTYSFTDGIVEAKVKMDNADVNNQIAELCGRNPTSSTGGYSNCIYRDSVSPDTRTNKIQKTHVATLVSQIWNFNFDQYYTLKMSFNGTSIKSYVNDTMMMSVTDSCYVSGRVACGANAQVGTGACFDDVRVRKYAAAPPTYVFGSEEDSGNDVPTWGNQTQNKSSISQGDNILLSANGYDFTGLNYAWLSTNETGIWQNYTMVDGYSPSFEMLEQTYLGTQGCCGSPRFSTGYSQITGDYSKLFFHHTPTIPVTGQVIAYGWYDVLNNTWSPDHIVKDDDDADASCMICCNATGWRYSYQTIPGDPIYDKWTNNAGTTWSLQIPSPFNGITRHVEWQPIDGDTEKAWLSWVPLSDLTHVHQRFFYYADESFGTETVAWELVNNDRAVLTKILNISGTYYAFTSAETGYAEYRTSTNLINWSASISTGVPRYTGGWGYSVDCDDHSCYMVLQSAARGTWMYSCDKALLNTMNWTYRLDLNVANAGIPGTNVINNTHMIAANQENTAQTHYGMLVKTHNATESKYGSPLKFSGSTNWEWANFTWSNSDYSDTTIGWKICFNDTTGLVNCTDVMSFDILLPPPVINISIYSKSPETLFTNYTGFLSASYIVESNYSLNFSSLAYLFGVNYTLTDDYHSYLKVPPNSIAGDGIYRAHNRNTTPVAGLASDPTEYMHWESNDTITEGNVWKWAGGDNSDFWIQNESINATHTWVNVTGRASNVFPSMFYLGRKASFESEKTGIEINKGQGVIFKIWDLEQYRGRSYDYYLSLYFDTQIESSPNADIEIWYCNDSFNPDADDPCLVCDYKDTWTSGRWLDHESWQPHSTVSFAKPLSIHAGTATCPSSPTEVNYIYLKSDTVSSKSYILNATNEDPNICNLTFAETETMWLRDETDGTNTPHPYTPSFYNTFTRDYLEFTHHLYIANDQDEWGHSDYNTQEIGLSDIPPTHCRYNYFWWNGTTDYYMNGSYTENFNINLTYGFDPDNGASLTHVLSLYDDDYNFIAFVNDSLIGNQTDVDIPFNVSGYLNKYSSDVYKFKIVSTDNEGSTSVTWSNEFCIKRDSWFKTTTPIITGFPAAIGGILTSFLSFLPLFIGILISGFLILVCVGVFGKLKRW